MTSGTAEYFGAEWGGRPDEPEPSGLGWPTLRSAERCDGENPMTGRACINGDHNGYHRDSIGAEWLDDGDLAKPDSKLLHAGERVGELQLGIRSVNWARLAEPLIRRDWRADPCIRARPAFQSSDPQRDFLRTEGRCSWHLSDNTRS